MSNEQLACLLACIEKQLSLAIEHASDSLPDDLPRMIKEVYKGDFSIPALDVKNWVRRPTGKPLCFSDLLDLRDDLRDQVVNLRKSDNQPT